MTGYQEAVEWLAAHAPDWRVRNSISALQPGRNVGDPTTLWVNVILQTLDEEPDGYRSWSDISLTGEGPTMLAAVQAAIGGWSKR